jgi:hypothetical protein
MLRRRGRHCCYRAAVTIAFEPSPAFAALAAHAWAYPALEVAHIVGIGLLLGNLVLVEARVWGFGPALPLPALARLALTLSLCGFALAAVSGLTMFATQRLRVFRTCPSSAPEGG